MLDPLSLAAAACVCQQWRAAADASPAWQAIGAGVIAVMPWQAAHFRAGHRAGFVTVVRGTHCQEESSPGLSRQVLSVRTLWAMALWAMSYGPWRQLLCHHSGSPDCNTTAGTSTLHTQKKKHRQTPHFQLVFAGCS